ncbi:MAG: hypothetical protein N3E40_06520 [Dehalococcoidia bacterium]|nr:hypothetical protein [Dehalococcoidia bacterium]
MDEITIQVIRQLISILKCTTCGRSYQETGIKVLSHKGNIWFINVRCSFCDSQNLVAAIVKEAEDHTKVTDLTPEEYTLFASRPPVNANDVLNIHYFLEDFDGDFKSLFNSLLP